MSGPLPVVTQPQGESPHYPLNASTNLQTVERFCKRLDKWLEVCENPNRSLRLMPSKDSKYRAYASAHALVREFRIERDGKPMFPASVADMKAIVRVTRHLV